MLKILHQFDKEIQINILLPNRQTVSQDLATEMNCCGKGSSSVSISGNGGGERLKAQAEAAVRALDNNNNNNKVILILNNKTSIYVLM